MALISCCTFATGPPPCYVSDSQEGLLASRLSTQWLPIRHFSTNVGNTVSVWPAEEPPTGRRRWTANSLHVVLLLTCALFRQNDRKLHENLHNLTIKRVTAKQGKCNTERGYALQDGGFARFYPTHPTTTTPHWQYTTIGCHRNSHAVTDDDSLWMMPVSCRHVTKA